MLSYLRAVPAVAILILIAIVTWQSGKIHRLNEHYASEHAGRLADRASYETAQKAAAEANRAQIQRVKSEQQEITDNAENRYNADLARLRAELAKRLPQGGTAAPQGASGKPAAPDLPNATPVPNDPAGVRISTGLYVRGAELELQLETLQQWVRRQLAVNPNQ